MGRDTCDGLRPGHLERHVRRTAMGLTVLPATASDGPVTVFYPSSGKDQPINRAEHRLNAAVDGAPVRGNGRLIVVSHGSGGSPWTLTDFTRHLVESGFVVAMPEHAGDNWRDYSQAGPKSWARRPPARPLRSAYCRRRRSLHRCRH